MEWACILMAVLRGKKSHVYDIYVSNKGLTFAVDTAFLECVTPWDLTRYLTIIRSNDSKSVHRVRGMCLFVGGRNSALLFCRILCH